MKLSKKLLAVILSVIILLAATIVPISAITASTVTMPEYYYVIENFDTASTYNWAATSKATYELSNTKIYGTEGSAAHVSWTESGWNGFKTTVTNANIELVGDGIAFWAHNTGSDLSVYVKLRNADNVYEKKITLAAGTDVYTIPYAEFKKNDAAIDSTKVVTQIEFTTSSTSAEYYVDELSCYSTSPIGGTTPDDEEETPVSMPEYYYVIENFDTASTYNWAATSTATYELSNTKIYGTEGSAAHVSWTEKGWSGFKTTVTNANIELVGDGIAFWADNTGSAIDVYVKLKNADNTYEKKITLAAGTGVYTIPYAEFKKNDAAIDATKVVTQIEFTTNATSAEYYVDELSCYSTTEIKDEEPVEMPEYYYVIENFDTASTYNWAATSKATYELSNTKIYGTEGSAAHVSWTESGWNGFKTTVTNANIELVGDGIAFWAHNTGNDLSVYVKLRNADNVYEKKITLAAGTNVYTIPYTEFLKNDAAIDTTKVVTQIEFTTSSASAEYYVDELSCYSTSPIGGTTPDEDEEEPTPSVSMPEYYYVIDNFDTASTYNWAATSTATYELSNVKKYGSEGSAAHVLWTEKGWSGFKTTVSNANIELVGDGIAFWAHNTGSDLSVYVKLRNADNVYEKKITLAAGTNVYTIPYTEFLKNDAAIDTTKVVTQIEFTTSATSAEYFVDELSCYSTTEIKEEKPVEMPECYFVIDCFDNASSYNWQGTNKASYELSGEHVYIAYGKSAHISWTEKGWNGFKTTVSNPNIVLKGDGITFWAYNAGENFDVYVKLRNADGAFEKKITLTSGAGAYVIPFEEFTKDGAAIDVAKTVSQIEFTSNASLADYYIDELAYYSDFVFSSVRVPDNFTLIENFDSTSTYNWAAHGKATYENYEKRGYGDAGKSAHVTWSESGYSGIKTTVSNANITLTGDGIAFWAYNAGDSISVFVKLRNSNGAYEKKITLAEGESVYKIPYAEFKKGEEVIDTTLSLTQIEFTTSASAANYYLDQIGCYIDPIKPATSTPLFDTSIKCSTSAIGGSGNGGKGGYDTVKWKLYEIKDDPRFARGCWFVAEDVTSGIFSFMNVSEIGLTEGVDLSAAQYYGNLNFWIKSDTANRSLKVALRNELSGQFSQYVEFTVTEANKWQQVTIPVSELVTDEILTGSPDFLKNVKVISFTGKDVEGTFQFGEEFKIAGVKVWDSDVPDYSEYDGLDTEPTQPEDDGSHSEDSEIVGHLDFVMDTYSGNPKFGTVTMQEYDEFASLQNGIKIEVGEGIRDDQMATKGLSIWFGNAGTAQTVDLSNLEDGYFSMWVRGNRAGMSFYFILMDDTVNDAKSSIVRTYTIKEANTWEEVRIRLCDYTPLGALDTEYVYMMSIRTGYGSFNWSKAYQDEQWLNTGDVLEITCANVTDGKPVNPFITPIEYDKEDNTEEDTDSNSGAENNTNTGTNSGSQGDINTDENDNSSTDKVSPDTSDSTVAFVMLLCFACINGLFAAFAKGKIKAR